MNNGRIQLYDKQPIKKANFPKAYKSFEGAKTYADWKSFIPLVTFYVNPRTQAPGVALPFCRSANVSLKVARSM
jgi:hypothetical protein